MPTCPLPTLASASTVGILIVAFLFNSKFCPASAFNGNGHLPYLRSPAVPCVVQTSRSLTFLCCSHLRLGDEAAVALGEVRGGSPQEEQQQLGALLLRCLGIGPEQLDEFDDREWVMATADDAGCACGALLKM